MSVNGFKDRYEFLSNMYECPIAWNGMYFMSTEAAYQSSKCRHINDAKVFENLSGKEAKRHSKSIQVRGDWDKIKINIMSQLVFQKFLIHPELRERLLFTEDEYLEETNTWKDTFWGVYNGIGENNLGKILMRTREYFTYEYKIK